jgi:glycosyltransferase involved in cell wall biosynthesis
VHIGIDASRGAQLRPTGTEHYSREIIQHLAAQAPADRITLYVNQWVDQSWRPPATVGVREMPMRRGWTHGRLSLEMLQAPPDVLFVPAHSIPLWHPPATVVTVHDLGYRKFPEAHDQAARAHRIWSTRFSVRAARRIIAVSESTRRDLLELEGVSPNRVRVVHHGCDPTLHPVEDPERLAEVRQRYRLPERFFLFIGTIQPRKNLQRLILAHRSLLARQPDAPALVLAGQEGWLSTEILQEAKYGFSAHAVMLPGYVAREDVAALLSTAVAFVYPSLYEGFGMPVLEAMACGAPVLTSNTSSLPEVAGDAALQVNPLQTAEIAQALERLSTDPEVRRDLRARGLRRAAQFRWERAAQQTLQVLRDAARERAVTA